MFALNDPQLVLVEGEHGERPEVIPVENKVTPELELRSATSLATLELRRRLPGLHLRSA